MKGLAPLEVSPARHQFPCHSQKPPTGTAGHCSVQVCSFTQERVHSRQEHLDLLSSDVQTPLKKPQPDVACVLPPLRELTARNTKIEASK